MEAVQNFDVIFFVLMAVALANALLAFIVARAGAKAENRVFALVALSVAGWSLTNAFFRTADTLGAATLWAQLAYLAALSNAATFFHFSRIYPRRSVTSNPKSHRLVYFLGAVIAALSFAPGLVVLGIDLDSRRILTGPGLWLVAGFMLASSAAAFWSLFQSQRRLHRRARAQARFVLYGSALTAVLGLFFNLLLPFLGNYHFVWLGPLSSLFFVGFSAYSIVAHHLFDVRILVRRTLVYTVLLGLLAGTFGALEKALEHLLLPLLGPDNFATGLVAALIVGFAVDPLKRQLHRFVSDKLFKGEKPGDERNDENDDD